MYIFYTTTYSPISSFRCCGTWDQVVAVKGILSYTRTPNWEDNLSEFILTAWPTTFHCNGMHCTKGLSSIKSLVGPFFFLSFWGGASPNSPRSSNIVVDTDIEDDEICTPSLSRPRDVV